MRIRTRLMLAFVGCGVIPIAVVGYLNYHTAVNGMATIGDTASTGFQERAQAQLVALRDVKKTQITRYCKDRQGDLNALVNNVAAMHQTASESLTTTHNAKKSAVAAVINQMVAETQILGSSNDTRALFTKLREYHDEMKTGEDQPYDVSTPAYQDITTNLGGPLRDFVKLGGCLNAYIVCLKHGHVMFSAAGGADAGTNLASGPYKDQGLATLWQTMRASKQPAISDFALYAAAEGKQVAFVGSPIVDTTGEMLGLVAIQISTDRINSVIQDRSGLGTTGESYLVGKVNGATSYRSDRVLKQGKVGEPISDPQVDAAFAGKSGCEQRTDNTGALELSCYAPLGIPGLDWVIVTSISLEEVIAPKFDAQEDVYTRFVKEYGYLVRPTSRRTRPVTAHRQRLLPRPTSRMGRWPWLSHCSCRKKASMRSCAAVQDWARPVART